MIKQVLFNMGLRGLQKPGLVVCGTTQGLRKIRTHCALADA